MYQFLSYLFQEFCSSPPVLVQNQIFETGANNLKYDVLDPSVLK